MPEQRKTKRFFTRVPVRVRGLDELSKPFTEESTTLEINRDGARIALRTVPRFDATLEITNLSRNLTASSQVTHRCPQSYSGLPEWGFEFLAAAPDFWGIAFEENSEKQELVVSALLGCKSCGRKEMVNLSRAEYEGLGDEYFLPRSCSICARATSWEVVARDDEEPPGAAAAGTESGDERRRARRLTLKAPIRVTTASGASESLEAQDISKTGLSFMASLELELGDRIEVSIGHGVAESPSVRKCLVIWRKPREKSGRHLYGVKFVDAVLPALEAESPGNPHA